MRSARASRAPVLRTRRLLTASQGQAAFTEDVVGDAVASVLETLP